MKIKEEIVGLISSVDIETVSVDILDLNVTVIFPLSICVCPKKDEFVKYQVIDDDGLTYERIVTYVSHSSIDAIHKNKELFQLWDSI